MCVRDGFCLCTSKVITFLFPEIIFFQFSFSNPLESFLTRVPRLLCKRGLRLPKCYQIKVKKFPFTNPEARRKRPRVCCLQRSMGLQSWLELPLWFAYLNVKLKRLLRLCSGGLALASLLSLARSRRWGCLSGALFILNRFFSGFSDRHWIWSKGSWDQFPWNLGCSATGFLSESVSSLAPREGRVNATGQEPTDAKNYRL